jgi:hypothetical protein
MHTWGTSEGGGGINLSRIVTVVTALISVVVLILALKKPNPLAPPQAPATMAANAESFQAKVDQLQQAQAHGQTGSEVHLTANEIGAAIAQAVVPSTGTAALSSSNSADASARPASGSIDATITDEPVISLERDIVRGQFVSEVAGKKVYITVAGHLGAKDGYATFQPTEFKVGNLNVPISLVNSQLQKKMMEQRDRLKLPEFISDVRVENGELVVKQK